MMVRAAHVSSTQSKKNNRLDVGESVVLSIPTQINNVAECKNNDSSEPR